MANGSTRWAESHDSGVDIMDFDQPFGNAKIKQRNPERWSPWQIMPLAIRLRAPRRSLANLADQTLEDIYQDLDDTSLQAGKS